MDITNNSLIKKLDKNIINKVSNYVKNDNLNPITFTNDEKEIMAKDMNTIEKGVLSWSEEFEKKNGRKPTYSDIRNEFG
jgi:hypothetical protein